MKLKNVWYIAKCEICGKEAPYKDVAFDGAKLCHGCWEIGHQINSIYSVKVAQHFIKKLKIRIKEIKTGYLNE